jgi:uncharacterized membrane protein YphA (DoxX/SURF4 family)
VFTSLGRQTAPENPEPIVRWHPAKRIGFRLLFSYFVLFNLPFPLLWIPYGVDLLERPWRLWNGIVVWTGEHVLHLSHPITVFSNGSWDTTYDYTSTLCKLAIGLTATLAWSWLDHKRPNYRTLSGWFRIYLRFALAQSMITSGAAKLFMLQFPGPRVSDLMTTYGASTPMHLLWVFMGASRTYNLFAGGVEMLGGILLVVPRLALLGSLVSLAALANVFILNVSYDVPVKLFSFHLLLMAVVLTAPDMRRLAAMFLFNRSAPAVSHVPLFRQRWLNYSLLSAQFAFGLVMIGSSAAADYQSYTAQVAAPDPVIHGIWVVDEFSASGPGQPPSSRDSGSWRQVIFDGPNEALVRFSSGWRQRYRQSANATEGTLAFWRREEPRPEEPQFSLVLTAADAMVMAGRFEGRQIQARLHRVSEPDAVFTTRGFH